MNIPLLVGGDFNLDLNTFEPFQDNSSLIRVHRPNVEQGRKDLNNAFVYTIDSIQITKTQTKQFHPDVFSSPWIVVTVKGRTQIKLWAVVKLQRFVRRYMLRMKKRKEGRIKMMETRERWRKKIEGPNYLPPPPPPAVTKHNGKRRQRFDDLKSVQERKQDEAQIENWLNYKP
ncbi:uncharacterized protein LOC111706622 [Eurytemora carolleeae]|uniref:uncharacterized protein LOC111706622 n=1 Tax=Eurytemora carolleeae TaxID=1294199 RepID=UPI000C77B7D1|nr:uncharacterized protein LOC111706622 [Eurytemora carolleeae]|eukprot:XP_023335303.1 uncharacterized protein LOC111706622 [Eurytemora affinis]